MKRIIPILLLISVISITAAGQADRPFRFGLHISPLIGWLKTDVAEYDSDGPTINLNYGFSTEFMIASNYTFATGLDIITNGGKLRYPHAMQINETDSFPQPGTLLRKYRTQYLQVPITIRMRTNEIGYFTFYGQFGFTTGFNIKSTADDEFDFSVSSTGGKINTENVDVKDDISFFRAGMLIGAGLEYSLGGSTALTAGVTFNNGFTDILKGKSNIDASIEENAISNVLEVSLGVIF